MKKKQTIILTQDEVLWQRNSWLKYQLCVTKDDVANGYNQDLFIDCGHIKSEGEEGRGNLPFVIVENKTKRYVILEHDPDSKREMPILQWWLDGAEGDLVGYGDNTWKFWDTVQEGVAYRNSGYFYALYALKLKPQTT